jgi:coenzyme F420-0:L-glutamate ligase
MEVAAIQTPIIENGQDLFGIFRENVKLPIEERTIICVTSKVIAVEQGRIIDLSKIKPSEKAEQMKKLRSRGDFPYSVQFAELVLQEADRIFSSNDDPGYVYLTLKDHLLTANAGIDLSNVPKGYAVLWPTEPWKWAQAFREKLKTFYNVAELGVLVTDSHVRPLRRGVTGVAVAYSGFIGVQSEIGKLDIYGNPLEFTEIAVADSLASVAAIVMGENAERKPFALITNSPAVFIDQSSNPLETYFKPKLDMYAGLFNGLL